MELTQLRIIYTIAGTGFGGYNGDGILATNANIQNPAGVYVDSAGNLFITDRINNRIRFVSKSGGSYYGITTTANYIYTIAGNGTTGSSGDGGPATSASLNGPYGIYVDSVGNVFFSDPGNNSRIRRVINKTSNKVINAFLINNVPVDIAQNSNYYISSIDAYSYTYNGN